MAWSLLRVTFLHVAVDLSPGWALVDVISVSLDLRKSTELISVLEANFMRFQIRAPRCTVLESAQGRGVWFWFTSKSSSY